MLNKLKAFLTHHKLLTGSFSFVFILILILFIFSTGKGKPEYIKPKYGEIVEAIYGLGKVKTDIIHDVKMGITTTVEKLYANEGDTVKKGDRLVLLDSGALFRAPFAGTVTQVNVTEKQTVFPQQTILRLEDYSKKYIEVALEQQGALRVKPGQPVRVIFESIRAEHLSGTVASIYSRNDEFLARIIVPSLGDSVLPGMTADVSIEVGRKSKALLIPVASINNGQVKILRDGKRLIIPLKIGNIDGSWAEVIEGDIQEDDLVIMKSVP